MSCNLERCLPKRCSCSFSLFSAQVLSCREVMCAWKYHTIYSSQIKRFLRPAFNTHWIYIFQLFLLDKDSLYFLIVVSRASGWNFIGVTMFLLSPFPKGSQKRVGGGNGHRPNGSLLRARIDCWLEPGLVIPIVPSVSFSVYFPTAVQSGGDYL